MRYTDLTIEISSENVQTASDILAMLDFGGIYIEDYSDMEDCDIVKQTGLIDKSLLEKDRSIARLHVYLAENIGVEDSLLYIEERFKASAVNYKYSVNPVDEEDYSECWKKYYKPFKIGEDMVIVPEWENCSPEPGDTVLRLNPGMAFGTGTHETTNMCLQFIRKYVSQGVSVLDIGCGSGILSIASLLCGAAEALAVDIDPNAVRVAYENAAANSFAGNFSAVAGDILDPDSAAWEKAHSHRFDIVVSNIIADVIIGLCSEVGELAAESGIFIMSGIISERFEDVQTAVRSAGFEIVEKEERKGWVCAAARRIGYGGV